MPKRSAFKKIILGLFVLILFPILVPMGPRRSMVGSLEPAVAAGAPLPSDGNPCPCTVIASLPYSINASGNYCLCSNLSTNIATDNAITINADFVLLDLNRYEISGASAGPTSHAKGVWSINHKAITVRNGTVRGFYNGIYLQGNSAWGLIEFMRVQDVTYEAIRVEGKGHIIRNNYVCNTTNNPNALTGGNGSSGAIGAYGSRNVVMNNDIFDTMGVTINGMGTGINLNASDLSLVENNRIVNTAGPQGAFGIYLGNSKDVEVVNNRIIVSRVGIYSNNATALYRDNIAIKCETRYFGGTDAGNNR